MTAEEVRTRYGISEEAWAAMRSATLEVLDITGEVVALAVRATPTVQENEDAFFYDVDWLQWFWVTYPGRTITGSMNPVDDTDEKFVWFMALD